MENNENEKEIETVIAIVIHTDGTFRAELEQLDTPLKGSRNANVNDVYKVSQDIITEIKNQQLTDRIVGTWLQVMASQQQPSTSSVVSDALKERGIQPESSAETA
jgi:hypothetical protein